MGTRRKRLDLLLVERGLYPTRSAARAAIMSGLIMVGCNRVDKSGTLVNEDIQIQVLETLRYVSRGGLKMEKALRHFSIDPKGWIIVDVGASTGGFTDCLLQAGAAKVYCIDVGYGQLDWRLRQDSRVIVLERTNIRYLEKEKIAEPVDLAVIDVSFISLSLVLPVLVGLRVPEIITLVKPQFEVGKGLVGKKGVVRDPEQHLSVLHNLEVKIKELEYHIAGVTFSPITGPQGNIEYLLHLKAGKYKGEDPGDTIFAAVVDEAVQCLRGGADQTGNNVEGKKG